MMLELFFLAVPLCIACRLILLQRQMMISYLFVLELLLLAGILLAPLSPENAPIFLLSSNIHALCWLINRNLDLAKGRDESLRPGGEETNPILSR